MSDKDYQRVRYTSDYNQAVNGFKPDILTEIRRREVNLAIWRDPLCGSTKSYLKTLPLLKLSKKAKKLEEACYLLSHVDIPPYKAKESIKELIKPLPYKEGKAALEEDLVRLTEAFKAATGKRPDSVQLLIYKPLKSLGGTWQTETGKKRGVITLKGDCGTLWHPNEHLPEEYDLEEVMAVDPETDKLHLQVKPHDFAIFNGSDTTNPLVHATPPRFMCAQHRLVAVLGCK
jgi:hypothetical protein